MEKQLAKKVTLVDGESVRIQSICGQQCNYIRIGPKLIAGVVNEPGWNGMYLWQEIDEIYVYFGDILFLHQKNNTILWKIFPWIADDIEDRALEMLIKQAKSYEKLSNCDSIRVKPNFKFLTGGYM